MQTYLAKLLSLLCGAAPAADTVGDKSKGWLLDAESDSAKFELLQKIEPESRTMKSMWPNDNGAIILIRLAVGLAVFFPEGLQKLLFPEILGAGRFAGIGIPVPEFFGPFVGIVETVCGLMIIG